MSVRFVITFVAILKRHLTYFFLDARFIDHLDMLTELLLQKKTKKPDVCRAYKITERISQSIHQGRNEALVFL